MDKQVVGGTRISSFSIVEVYHDNLLYTMFKFYEMWSLVLCCRNKITEIKFLSFKAAKSSQNLLDSIFPNIYFVHLCKEHQHILESFQKYVFRVFFSKKIMKNGLFHLHLQFSSFPQSILAAQKCLLTSANISL